MLFLETGVVYAGRSIDLMPMVHEVVPDLLKHELQLAVLLPDSRSSHEQSAEKKISSAVGNSEEGARWISSYNPVYEVMTHS